ncbi:D-alanyl-D-alanine carboxypeptidase (penicillin-binding protein 5/6) [Gracilibacillus alcaliphilus]|nr:D-alanyl-D-alanine carboxypeptidase family protein [Gracilibacillus alcaliphilus]MBM7675116.1 D-alanyl-D-alanine carboxypeptidase (penicillin-binding protein 5/6) [Gracilibacillus alcaliphilus]
MNKSIISLVCILSIFISYPSITWAQSQEKETAETAEDNGLELAKHSKSAILMERDTGTILYDKNAEEKLPPASMTKVMTMLLIMEALDEGKLSLTEQVTVSEYAASMGGSQIFLEAGEEMTVQDLLKGIAVASGNDASMAMAERIAGSEESFVKMMNDKVKELGLTSTQFQNPTGLPAENHYSTAYDMAVMAKELLKHEEITEYTGIYEDYLRQGTEDEFWLVNTNKLVKFYDGVDGLKTGYTSEAKFCLTATAEKNGMRTIAVVMGADNTKNRNSDVSQLLDYAYSQFETKKLYEKNQPVTSFEWFKANKQPIDIITDDNVSILYPKGMDLDQLDTKISIDQDIELPLTKGTKVGQVIVTDGEETISETDLVVAEDLDKANLFQLFKRTFASFFSL